VYGLNLGYGSTQAKAYDVGNATQLESPWQGDFTGALRVAFAPNETFTYGLDFSGWVDRTLTYNDERVDTRVFYFLLQAHWFPGGQGFYVRGGVGAGSLGLTYRDIVTVSKSKGGFCWGAGAGYEIRVSDTFAIGAAYDYRWISVGEFAGVFDDTQAATQAVTMSFTWYPD
jgi:hypothetical protein